MTALRLWPFEGHLALTPVTVHGVVRTLPDADLKPLPTSSITVSVKCIESRVGLRANVSRILAEYSKVLWSKPDDQEFADVPLLELPFRIVIPTDTPGFSTSLFLEYRCVWRVEAVLHHIPLPVVGHRQIKHFQLPLISYALPPFAPTPSFTLPPLHQQTHKPGVPSVRYTVNAPTTPIGPLDMVSVPIYLLPLDPGLTVRSASAVVERRIQFSSSVADPSGLPPSSESLTIPFTTDLTNNSSTSLASYSQTDATVSVAASEDSSNPTITPHTFFPSQSTVHQPLLPPRPPLGDELSPPQSSSSSSVPSNTRVSVVQIATTQSSGAFSLDPTRGIFSKTLTLQWPESKSYSRWQVGSTLQSDLVSIRFYLRIKIVVLTGSSSSNTQTLELAEQELLIVPTNDAERRIAASQSISDPENPRRFDFLLQSTKSALISTF
ncbi:hypothetical protein DL96DRAFT_444733 [Flagelloscypha sp. PMI_526]|nr:hypothetical protein DL96DRAFT_444733 [Flagelloscypha sp. PMI_526]